MYCRNCGNEVTPQQEICLKCGVRPMNSDKFCQNCGKPTAANQEICVSCGVRVGLARPPAPREGTVTIGMGILWFLVCSPIGYMQWGQGAKGWVLVLGIILAIVVTLGFGAVLGLVITIDYWMSWNAQQYRKLGEWEFFPTA